MTEAGVGMYGTHGFRVQGRNPKKTKISFFSQNIRVFPHIIQVLKLII